MTAYGDDNMKLIYQANANGSTHTAKTPNGRYAWHCKQPVVAKPKGIKSNMNNTAIPQQK